ncbi:hypothetical protein PF003_g2124 [Phytophthora fragariae]|nr:hypothetical protein PF003_g2124 [Phytophthora fragariae]
MPASRVVTITAIVMAAVQATTEYSTKSGILPWVDPVTPNNRQTYTSSRGGTWDLVMSDEFNTEGRSFEPGDDHLWTSMEKADGVNSALEIYMHHMTGTECDDDGTCYFFIEANTGETTLTLWNDYLSPAGYEDVTFYYKAGMVQSWNKFCLQGGMVEVRAQLPGAVTNASGNPDVATGSGSDAAQMNPKKLMLEEPMYVIFNVALSSTWGTTPPNAGNGDCYGDGSDATTNAICDAFPMYLKIDYIRVYQDKSAGSSMAVGCDPSTHPTKQWIEDNIASYVDDDNPWTEVSGKAFCTSNEDCTIETNSSTAITTGTCVSGRCKCSATTWTGPRCTVASSGSSDSSSDGLFSSNSYGPPMYVSGVFMAVIVLTTFVSVYVSILTAHKSDETLQKEIASKRGAAAMPPASLGDSMAKPPKDNCNYSTNFV